MAFFILLFFLARLEIKEVRGVDGCGGGAEGGWMYFLQLNSIDVSSHAGRGKQANK